MFLLFQAIAWTVGIIMLMVFYVVAWPIGLFLTVLIILGLCKKK